MWNLDGRYRVLRSLMDGLQDENQRVDFSSEFDESDKKNPWVGVWKRFRINGDSRNLLIRILNEFRWFKINLKVLESEAAVKMQDFGPLQRSKLIEVWNIFNPFSALQNDYPDGHRGRFWIDIGFQGEEPETDFRGSGRLGLAMLHDFAKNYYV